MNTIEIRKVEAGRGAAWWSESWSLMTRSFGPWAAVGFVGIVLQMAATSVPILGSLAAEAVKWPLYAAYCYMAREAAHGREVKFEDMFYGFKRHFGEMTMLAAISIGGVLLFLLLFAGGGAVLMWNQVKDSVAAIQAERFQEAFQLGAPWLMVTLIGLALGLLVVIVAQFSIPLVVFHKIPVGAAMRLTWKGLNSNFGAVFVGSVMFTVWLIVACLPLFLGLIIFIPWSMAAQYKFYVDVFGEVNEVTPS